MLALAASFAPAAAQSSDPDLPPVDPPGLWRQMTLDDATSDSKCVGRFDTPLCAVETVVACYTRGINELCSSARLDADTYRFTSGNHGFRTGERYRVVRAERLTDDTILDIPRETGPLQAGDIRVDVIYGSCFTNNGVRYCTRPFSNPLIYTLRKTPTGWRIIDWGGPDIRWPGRKRP